MSTQFTNRQWRLPNNENKDKQSNYSMEFLTTTRIPDITGLGLGTSVDTFSISLWFNKSNMNYGIVFSAYSGSGSYPSSGVAIDLNTDGTIAFYNGANRKTTSAQYSINTWYNLVVTSDGTTVKMYVNGSQVTLDSTTVVARDFTNVWINSAKYSASNFGIIGKIDGVAIFDYALTDGTGGTVNQIAALYGSSSTGIGNPMSLSPKPVAYYPLGDQDSFNGADYLVPNSSLKDYVFDFELNTASSADEYISIFPNNELNGLTNVTFAGWFYARATNVYDGIYTNRSSGGYVLIYPDYVTTNTFRIRAAIQANGVTSYVNSDYVSINQWYHFALVCENGSTLKIYINGEDAVYTSGTNFSSIVQTTFFKIGSDGWNRNWNGFFSNFQVWDTNLSLTDAATLYNNGSPITTLANIPQNSNLQGWWKLNASDTYDSSTGNWTIEDHAGSNDGTSSGMTQANLVQSDLSFTSGYSPYALDFDSASSDYIDFNSIDLGTTNTISFWHKRGNTTANQNILGSLDGTQKHIVYFTAGYIYIRPDGSTQFITAYLANTPYPFPPYKNTTDWANYIITRSGDNIKLYLNGVEFALSGSGIGMAATTVNRIGTKGNSVTGTIDGELSNVSFWNTALTSSQVSEIYNEGVPSNLNNHSAYSNLVSWWQLGSNTSWVDPYWIALDEKGTNNGQSQNVAAPNNMGESAIVDGVGSYANGVSSGMSDAIVGDAFGSSANSLSYNMDVLDRTEDTPS